LALHPFDGTADVWDSWQLLRKGADHGSESDTGRLQGLAGGTQCAWQAPMRPPGPLPILLYYKHLRHETAKLVFCPCRTV
jgi:hypothetical protein